MTYFFPEEHNIIQQIHVFLLITKKYMYQR